MGQEGYIIRTGIGFDIDRRSGQEAVGFMESIADTINNSHMKKSVEGIQKRNSALSKENDKLDTKNKDAMKKREKEVGDSAKATHAAILAGLPERPERLTPKTKVETAAFGRYKKELKKMGDAYQKFADRASDAKIKVNKESFGGKAGPENVQKFAKAEAAERQRQINLTRQMIDENKNLIKQKRKGATEAKADNEFLMQQERQMVLLDKESLQAEKKEANQKRKNFNEYKKQAAKLHKQNRKELEDIKTRTIHYKKLGAAAGNYVRGLAGGMKNAFVIGTAAAAAFAYKLQPVVEEVMLFEKTIINANSVFRESNEVLHEVSDSLVQFSLQYGISTTKAAEGLYQLASAGLSAAESQEVLQHTLKLAMATQGDHNTLAKLTVQTIKGFGLEMSDAEMLTDKFAHTIQKSLVEWQDLASSVKFAMPFFQATGQSIDQLLGGIEVLSNRALEAGIAGRGLRQALAQLAKHADDNASAFARLGVETMNADGTMRQLTDIAQDAKAAFGDVTDIEALIAMLEDMNVRGATAFALLVQNADEYSGAVSDLANSAGEATAMADEQQKSLANQIQLVKNALMAPFFFSDRVGESEETLNKFTLRLKEITDEFVGFFIQGEKGEEVLTDFAYAIQDFVVNTLDELLIVVRELKKVFLEQDEGLEVFTKLMKLSTKPMLIMLKILDRMGPHLLNTLVWYKVMSKLIPFNTILTYMNTRATTALAFALHEKNKAEVTEAVMYGPKNLQKVTDIGLTWGKTAALWAENAGLIAVNQTSMKLMLTTKMMFGVLGAGLLIMAVAIRTSGALGDVLGALAGIMFTLALVSGLRKTFNLPFPASIAAWAATLAVGAAAGVAIKHLAANYFGYSGGGGGGGGGTDSVIGVGELPTERSYDLGGTYIPMRETGGPTAEHGLAWLQKGETVVPKTQNMLGEGSGITVNMGDVNAQDGTDFAEKLAEALPAAIRRQSDVGAI